MEGMGNLIPDSPEYPDLVPSPGPGQELIEAAQLLGVAALIGISLSAPLLHREPMRCDDAPHQDHTSSVPFGTYSAAVSSSTGADHVITPATGQISMAGNPVEWSVRVGS
jgi:hypothetical protein